MRTMNDAQPRPTCAHLAHDVAMRSDALFNVRFVDNAVRTDRLFAGLILLQWTAAIVGALVVSPRTWAGSQYETHVHVWAAVLLGGAIAVFPVWLALSRPGSTVNRHVIAAAEMLMAGLLIHVTGGRIETHFHIFGCLAFLAFYRDWRIFIAATVVVALDHLVRGVYWPRSVYGVLTASPWRSVEHAAWVVFENIFLIWSCRQSEREMRDLAAQHVQLESTNEIIEAEVTARTEELRAVQRELVDSSRRAGMAEIATGVLHNVGNVLNSVNVSTGLLTESIQHSKIGGVARAADLMRQNEATLDQFFTTDQRGRQLPKYLASLSEALGAEQQGMLSELESLTQSVNHIKAIVSTQQDYARSSNVNESVRVADVVADALRMSSASFERHGVEIDVRTPDDLPALSLDRQKMLAILINLIKNAKNAMCDEPVPVRRLTIHAAIEDRALRLEVRDTGIGIARENLIRVFEHGFTTRPSGNGFGLHTSALSAQEMGGALTAESDGPGRGARFILRLPAAQELSV
jgi:signal transduction histidine kinase